MCLMMVRARMWPLKHPICPDRMALKGQVLLLFVYSGGNRGGEGKCKFFEDGRGREIFIINCIFPINYVLSPRAEMWAWVSSYQLRRTSHISATASRGSALAVPKTQAVLRQGLIVYQKVKVQTLIMQKSAGHQPTISIPQPKLLIPSCKPSRLCWSQTSLAQWLCFMPVFPPTTCLALHLIKIERDNKNIH